MIQIKESEYIYKRLKFLSDEVEFLYNALESQQKMTEDLMTAITVMQSPEYARKQANTATALDVAEKMQMMRNMMKKN